MTPHQIITKLIGPVMSTGDSREDWERMRNLEATIELVDRLVFDLVEASRDAGLKASSRAAIGKKAKEFVAHHQVPVPEVS